MPMHDLSSKKMAKKIKSSFNIINILKNTEIKLFFRYAIFIIAAVFTIFILVTTYIPSIKKYKSGQICARDIYAPFDFSFRNEANNICEVKKDEIILQKGQRVTGNHQLYLNEMLKHQYVTNRIYLFLGATLLTALFFILLIIYFKIYKVPQAIKTKNLILICIFAILALLTAKLFIQMQSPIYIYLIPLSSVAMTLAMLINARTSFIVIIVLGLLIGVMDNLNIALSIILIIGSMIGIYAVYQIRRRAHLTIAGILVGLANFISIVATGLLGGSSLNEQVSYGLLGIANGIGSAIITAGISPVFESTFRIMTNISLLELSDFNQPLLKDLNMHAPGTYHHSLVVGNLSETAAEALGANSLLARVGAYYHDIGKMKMPQYFSENQTEDKHDKLAPTISTLIITNHVKEGVELGQKNKLSREIIDIIEQHHGTSLVYYFYHRALGRTDEEDNIEKETFRYPGPKPQTKEAAIVLLADSVEAASRTLSEPTPVRLTELVHRVINNKFTDSQLDECDLSLKDLHKITEIFTHILTGIYHTRIEYPAQNTRNGKHKNKKSAEIKED